MSSETFCLLAAIVVVHSTLSREEKADQ